MPRLSEDHYSDQDYNTVRIPQKEIDAIVDKEREKRGLLPIVTNSDNKPKANSSKSAAKAMNELGEIADGNGVNDGTAGFADNYPDGTIVNLGPNVEDYERIIVPRPIIQPESYTMRDDSIIQREREGKDKDQRQTPETDSSKERSPILEFRNEGFNKENIDGIISLVENLPATQNSKETMITLLRGQQIRLDSQQYDQQLGLINQLKTLKINVRSNGSTRQVTLMKVIESLAKTPKETDNISDEEREIRASARQLLEEIREVEEWLAREAEIQKIA